MDCYLTVYEQFTWPHQMARECVRLGLSPILLDHGSTYKPLLRWLENCPYPVIRAHHNAGCYGFWRSGRYLTMTSQYIVSDSDLDLTRVPDDTVERLRNALSQNPDVAKAGLSLEIEDIPASYPFREHVLTWERPYWTEKRPGGWRANIGATFALYDPKRHGQLEHDFYSAVRLDRPYTAKHLPWYLDLDELTPELRYYYERCDDLAYWSSRTRNFLQGITP